MLAVKRSQKLRNNEVRKQTVVDVVNAVLNINGVRLGMLLELKKEDGQR